LLCQRRARQHAGRNDQGEGQQDKPDYPCHATIPR
jgi:hypothetical protein